ncbi:MAG: ABC transporter permease, partial [Dehalococcoidia bacterium]
DMLSRIIYGARITAIVGFGAVAIAGFVSIVVGGASGFWGGWLDMATQRIVDIWMSFPTIILAVSLIAIIQPGLWPVVIVLGIIWAARGVRIVRGSVLSLKENPYIEAARVVGSPDVAILLRHLLPNVLPVVVVFATIQIGSVILAEAAISFLGYGIPPPFPSWGQMLSGSALRFMEQHPVMALWPGLAIMLVVFGFNVLGDALRDVWDPRMRGSR